MRKEKNYSRVKTHGTLLFGTLESTVNKAITGITVEGRSNCAHGLRRRGNLSISSRICLAIDSA
jgi:hypothetical protein